MDNEGGRPKQSEVYSSWPERNLQHTHDKTRSGRKSFDIQIDRRKVVKVAALAGVSLAAGIGEYEFAKRDDRNTLNNAAILNGNSSQENSQIQIEETEQNTSIPNSEKAATPETEKPSSALLYKDDSEIQVLANELKLSPNSFFDEKRLNASYYAHQSDELFNVFLPRVMQRKDKLYQWAKESELPVNVVATIMNLESGGINDLTSEAEAVGLFQVIPTLHMPDGLSKEEMMDPDINAKYALKYFNTLLGEARTYLENKHPGKEYRPGHPEVFIQAMAMYNAGATGGAGEFKELPPQTQDYITQARGLFKTMEIAQKLRYEHKTNDEIVMALRSQTMDARGKVFELIRTQQLENPFNSENPYFVGDDKLFEYLGQDVFPPTDNPKIQKLIDAYTEYYEGHDDQYTVPLGPSLRIWTQISPMFVLNDPINRDPEKYFGIDTKKSIA